MIITVKKYWYQNLIKMLRIYTALTNLYIFYILLEILMSFTEFTRLYSAQKVTEPIMMSYVGN